MTENRFSRYAPTENRFSKYDGPSVANEAAMFSARKAELDPTDLMIARGKNDGFGRWLREQAKEPRPGETDEQRGLRLGGRLTREGSAGMVEAQAPWGSKAANFLDLPGVGRLVDETLAPASAALGGISQEDAQRNIELGREGFQNRRPWSATGLSAAGTVAAVMASGPFGRGVGNAVVKAAPASPLGQTVYAAGLGSTAAALDASSRGYGDGSGGPLSESRMEGATDLQNMVPSAILGGVLPAAGLWLGKGASKLAKGVMDYSAARKVTAAGMTPETTRVLADAIDNADPQEVARRLAKAGDNATLADAGKPFLDVLDASVQATGGGQALTRTRNRAAQELGNLTDALDGVMGRPGMSSSTAVVVTGQKRSPWSQLYDRAFSKPIDWASEKGREIEAFLKNNVPASAIKKANDLLRLDPDYTGSKQIMAEISEDGAVKFVGMPDVRQIDAITRAMNDLVTESGGAFGKMTESSMLHANLSRDIRERLKFLVPEYRQALDAAATRIRGLNAKDLGKEILTGGVWMDDVGDLLKGKGTAEIAKVKEGMRLFIDQQMGKVKMAMTEQDMDLREAIGGLRLLSDRSTRTKMAAVLGPEDTAKIMKTLEEAASSMEVFAGVADNSKTFARFNVADTVRDMTGGGPLDAVMRGEGVNATKRVTQALTGATDEAQRAAQKKILRDVADQLTRSRGATAAQNAFGLLSQARNGVLTAPNRAAAFGRGVGVGVGLPAYLATRPNQGSQRR